MSYVRAQGSELRAQYHSSESKCQSIEPTCHILELKVQSSELKYHSSESKCQSIEPTCHMLELKVQSSELKYLSSESKCHCSELKR